MFRATCRVCSVVKIGNFDCRKMVDHGLFNQHSLPLKEDSSNKYRQKKSVPEDFHKIYSHFCLIHFTPSLPILPPVDPTKLFADEIKLFSLQIEYPVVKYDKKLSLKLNVYIIIHSFLMMLAFQELAVKQKVCCILVIQRVSQKNVYKFSWVWR